VRGDLAYIVSQSTASGVAGAATESEELMILTPRRLWLEDLGNPLVIAPPPAFLRSAACARHS
jgi:hypothetical protein